MNDTDYGLLPNPYDFANPVSNPRLFVGMKPEIDDIKYYLRHSSRSARPINLAIVGPRASGKTSMLNMLDAEARANGFCVARVDLDESDSASEMRFFYKIFDSILTSACECGAYGGKAGNTYGVYRDMVDAFELPQDPLFSPFIFPRQYAKAPATSDSAVLLSDAAFKSDLMSIQGELKRPTAVLFDESDVLSKNALLLQKLRNIFMNIPGFMLVIAATPTLFPIMDEVFSPIIRQFKKINLRPFNKHSDTQDCMIKPLREVGADPLADTLEQDREVIHEIHEVSGGRPYEVQLICHFMFKRVQQARAKRMELTIDVLEDLRRELEATQDVSARPVLAKVRLLRRDELRALAPLTLSNGRATFEQLWFVEYVQRPQTPWTRQGLLAHLEEFVRLGILTVQDDVVRFEGDDFDRLYCKYFARSHGVSLNIVDLPPELLIWMRLGELVSAHPDSVEILPAAISTESAQEMPDLEEVHKGLLTGQFRSDPFASRSDMAQAIYWCSISARKRTEFTIAAMTLSTPWARIGEWCSVVDQSPDGHFLAKFCEDFQQLAEKAAELGAQFDLSVKSLAVIPAATLDQRVTTSENSDSRERIGRQHCDLIADAYLQKSDIEEALFHAELGVKYATLTARHSNNIGYLNLAADRLHTAREFLVQSISQSKSESELLFPALPTYNLAIVDAKLGDYPRSLAKLAELAASLSAISKGQRECVCLFVPSYSGGCLAFPEVRDIDLLEATNTAIVAITEAQQ